MGGPVGILTGTEQSGKAGDATETSRSLFNGGRGGHGGLKAARMDRGVHFICGAVQDVHLRLGEKNGRLC